MLRKIVANILPTTDIYTDGSFKQGRGSWAYVVSRSGRIIKEASGSCRKTSSLAMEIHAAVEALRASPPHTKLRVYSDSRILVDAMQGHSQRQGKNLDRFADLRGLSAKRRVSWIWIKAHAGHPMNERCDQLCVAARH